VTRVWIAGSGRMARSIGAHLLLSGLPVTWLSRDAGRRDELAGFAAKAARRAARALGTAPEAVAALLGQGGSAPPGAVIEVVEEDRAAKRAVWTALAPHLPPGCLRLTGSSSLLPEEIAPGLLGLHFFHPVELCPWVELVSPPGAVAADVAGARALAEGAGLQVVEESGPAALLANRLLLPAQALAAGAVEAGLPPAEVDAAARGGLLPLGPLALMDEVGLDLIAAGVENYRRRMPPVEGAELDGLRRVLGALRAEGRRGRAAGDGFLAPRPLPWAPRAPRPGELEALAAGCRRGLLAGAARALGAGWLGREALGRLVQGALSWAEGLEALEENEA
jgi:3-hydroxyacyl-CoA dehydrogenase